MSTLHKKNYLKTKKILEIGDINRIINGTKKESCFCRGVVCEIF